MPGGSYYRSIRLRRPGKAMVKAYTHDTEDDLLTSELALDLELILKSIESRRPSVVRRGVEKS